MNSNILITLPVTENARNFRKRQEQFFEISRKICNAWDVMGYDGDPVVELITAIQGMYVWAPQ